MELITSLFELLLWAVMVPHASVLCALRIPHFAHIPHMTSCDTSVCIYIIADNCAILSRENSSCHTIYIPQF